jgi:hypothetical protein
VPDLTEFRKSGFKPLRTAKISGPRVVNPLADTPRTWTRRDQHIKGKVHFTVVKRFEGPRGAFLATVWAGRRGWHIAVTEDGSTNAMTLHDSKGMITFSTPTAAMEYADRARL